MGKKGRRCKTRWRRLPMGGERNGEDAEDDDCGEEGGGGGSDCREQGGRCPSAAALGGRERAKGGGSDGAASPQQQNGGPRQAAASSSASAAPNAHHHHHHAPYKGGARTAGRGGFGGRRGGAAVTDKKGGAGGGAASGVYTFNEEEYTKITTPRQDVLFKKGYLMARKKDVPVTSTAASTNGSTPTPVEVTNGEATSNGTSGTHNGDASSSSDQTYSAHVSGSGAEDESGGCNGGYAYVNGYTNGYSYGGGAYHMDQSGAMPNGGAYFVNGGSYELYDPYAAMAAAAGYAFPYVGAPPPHQPPPHTLPPLQTIDWYASRPPGSTGDVQWCQLVASPGYSETRRKRYSTDSQNCSPPSSESTGPPGSPQEEAVSSSGGDACHAHQPIPQYHHAHVFQGPHPHAATYVYPGYLFGPAVYSVNGVPLAAATPIHPLHGLSQSIHVHPSAAVAAPGPVPGPQGGVPGAAAPGSDGGSQRRRKKKRRRKRKRGLTDDASEETSSEVGEEEGGGGGGGVTCGACSVGGVGSGGAGARDEEFEEDEEEEEEEEEDEQVGPVVVVRLGNVVPLVMSQQAPQGPPVMVPSQPYAPADGPTGGAGGRGLEGRDAEASSTDCSELSGHPESSSSTSGGEETVRDPEEERPARASRADGDAGHEQAKATAAEDSDVPTGVVDEVGADEVSTAGQAEMAEGAETREMWTQSPPEVAVQVSQNEPATPPPSPGSIQPLVAEVASPAADESAGGLDDNNPKERSEEGHAETRAEVADGEKPSVVEDKPQGAQKNGRRRNGRGRNNKMSVPMIQSEELPPDEPKPSTPPAAVSHPDEVEVREVEPPQPVQFIQEETLEVQKPFSEPAQELTEGPKTEPPAAKVEPPPAEEEVVISKIAPAPVQQVAPAQAQNAPEPSPEKKLEPATSNLEQVERTTNVTDEVLPHVEEKPTDAEVEPTNERLSVETERSSPPEPEVKPQITLPLDTFTFKPEPYKHPMLNSPKKEVKEEPSLIREVLNRETNGEANLDHEEEKTEVKLRESSSPSRHLQDMPRRKARLKMPPEREESPGKLVEGVEVNGKRETEVADVTTTLEKVEKEAASVVTGTPDNNRQGEEEQRPVTPVQSSPADEDTISKEETLTEVVSKWLEENSDALPESLEEIKGEELKTEAVSTVEAEGEGISTGSKNGVRNPFPAPSNRSPKFEKKSACVSECVSVCESNECACAFSGDGPVKRVANRIFGAGDDDVKKEEVETRRERGEQKDAGGGGRREGGERVSRVTCGSVGEEEEDDRGSCEWEPMTVEAPRRNFADLESWKRLRGGLGGSAEALKSLGSYRDDEEEEERMSKARINMCDPTASVAKYYCLGAARVTKSPSPSEKAPVKAGEPVIAPAPTDSGVQTEEEEEEDDVFSVATAEEAKEELPTGQRKARVHKPVGLGKTAAFVARQIGATESAKGPFPCGICCIIQ